MTAIRFPYRRPRQGGETSVVGSRSPAASPAPCVGYCTQRFLNVRHRRRGTNSTKFAVAQHLRRSGRSGRPEEARAVGGARPWRRSRQQVAPLGGVLRADITTRLFANRLTARWRLLTIERSGASSSRLLALWPPSTAKFRLSALAHISVA